MSKGRERGQAGGTKPRHVVLGVTTTTRQCESCSIANR